MIGVIIVVGLASIGLYILFEKEKPITLDDVPPKWAPILEEKVRYYRSLNPDEKKRFLIECARFFSYVKINGVHFEVTLEDRLLVAASAVIPLFGFPGWDYQHLDEVVIFPSHFDRKFNYKNPKEMITGLVGNGPMEGKMILSLKALRVGFDNTQDKENVGIHEFIHIYDKEDGEIDGVPQAFVDKSFVLPWLKQVEGEMRAIRENESSLQSYGGTNKQEFLAVAGEYFFERPHLLKSKHPELYDMLVMTFNQDPTEFLSKTEERPLELGRNSPCPCGSGLKYKRCCMT